MSEFAGLAYYAEVPAVVFDIQRVGPSTGLPTRTAQGDLLFAAVNSHGDTRHVMLLPGSVEECYEMAMEAFDLAERLQTVVFVLSDLDLGMNTWMARPFSYPDKPIDRGKVLDEAKVRELGASWGRYKDVDGDGIPWRSVPGHRRAGVFHARLRPQRDGPVHASGRTTTSGTSTVCRGSSIPPGRMVPRARRSA